MSEILSRNELIELYLSEARVFYPNIRMNSAFSMYSGEQEFPRSGKIQFNCGLIDQSFIDSESFQVIHYTSLSSFFEIVNSETIRLYNCYNLNDPKEIEHGLNSLNFPFDKSWLDNLKRNHFVLSSSRYDEAVKDDFNLWRLYGQDGMGVGMVFEIPREIKNWNGVNLSKIEYSSDNSNESLSKRFLDYHQAFQSKYKLFENIPAIIPLLASFQKHEIWKIENEIRVVALCPFDKYSLKNKKGAFEDSNPFLSKTLAHTINSKGDHVAYVNMPISKHCIQKNLAPNTDNEMQQSILRVHPYLKLNKVILGPRLVNSNQFHRVVEFIHHVASVKLGENIMIEESKHKDIYKS